MADKIARTVTGYVIGAIADAALVQLGFPRHTAKVIGAIVRRAGGARPDLELNQVQPVSLIRNGHPRVLQRPGEPLEQGPALIRSGVPPGDRDSYPCA